MAGSIYGTRVTVVQNGDGAGVEINSGQPCAIHNVHIANAAAGAAQAFTFTETTTAGGAIANEVGAMSIAATGGSDDWNPEAIFDKGFRVGQEPAAGTFITVVWRPGV